MEEKVIAKMEESISRIIDEGVTTNNLDHLYKLSKIKHLAKEDKDMYNDYGNYGNYGARRPGYDSYGDNYGRRGRDMKYRGDEQIDRISDHYGRYMDYRGRYGANEDTLKSLEYMLESAVNFFDMLKSDANSQEEMNMIRKYAQKIAQM
jgi:hypothetical protein